MKTTPIWLFTGPEIGEKNDAIKEIQKKLSKENNLETYSFYVSETKISDLISLLQNGSLFADSRFVVLKNAEEIKKKEDIELLVSWSKSSVEFNSYLILVSNEIGIDKKIENIVPKQNKRIFWEMFENQKEQWIFNFFQKEGFKISSEAVGSLLELIENNTDALRSVCSQLVLFFPSGYHIEEDDIESTLAHTKEENAFSLFDALTYNDFELSLEIFRKIVMSKDSSPIQIIAGLTYCFRRLNDWHSLMLDGMKNDYELKRNGFTSKRAVDQYRRASRNWDSKQTTNILSLLANTDSEIRISGTAVANLLMELCLYSLCNKKGSSLEVVKYL